MLPSNFRFLSAAIAALLSLSTLSPSQTVSVSGVVKNRATNAAIPGASVVLEGYGLSTQSDASGNFTLTGLVTGALPSSLPVLPPRKNTTVNRRGILLNVNSTAPVAVTFYTPAGRSVFSVRKNTLARGQWQLSPRLTPGAYVCRIEINGTVSTLKYLCAVKSAAPESFSRTGDLAAQAVKTPEAKLASASYTLAVSKSLFVTNRQALAGGTVTGLTVLLDSIQFSTGMTEAQVRTNLRSLIGTDSVIFIKRNTYNSNHYYTEYIGGDWLPGGNICILNLATGTVRNVITSLSNGVFRHIDVSYDGKKVVFDFKKSLMTGYRIYEADIATGTVKQLTFPQANEDSLIQVYQSGASQGPNVYHHGTDDMDPVYLPDGGVAFISTRCQIGTPCDGPDGFTTTNMYRINGDGSALRPLSRGMASETNPSVMPDGRILYTRWEYVDKGGSCVKCLWAMFPNGAASSEIYGNDIELPPSKVQSRAIPGAMNKYIFLGAPHYPQNQLGTVIKVDMNKNIRTRDPMSWITKDVDVRGEGGWWWSSTGTGNLYRNPFPLSEDLYLVAFKPGNTDCYLKNGYGLYVLDGTGRQFQFYRDAAISCWDPQPLKPRPVEPVPYIALDPTLAAQNQAICTVNDIYYGMENVARGSIKYIRIMEQTPRPWTARRFWPGDGQGTGQQHSPVSKSTRIWPGVMWGVVPVESDGSANFIVPANRAVFFHALDSNYRMIQYERTFVNYMPGEKRSCHGCHETPDQVIPPPSQIPLAMRRAPSVPGPHPGDTAAHKVLTYPEYVQPIFDKNCIACHNPVDLKGNLNLKGDQTYLFSTSYEQLLDRRPLLGDPIDEIGPKVGNAAYMPAKSMYSNQSAIMKMLGAPGITITNATNAARATVLATQHRDIHLTQAELVNLGLWIDNNCQYYGHYWGRKGTEYLGRGDYRPRVTFEQAIATVSPVFDTSIVTPPDTTPDTLWYKFNETAGTTANDASSQKRNGTLTGGASWTTGKTGNAVSLNGTDGYVSMPDFGALQKITICLWVNPVSITKQFNAIMHGNGWDGGDVHSMVRSDGKVQFSLNGASPTDQMSNGTISTGTWQHIALVYDMNAQTVRFYINGALDATRAYTGRQMAILVGGVRIGSWSGGGREWTGKIDDFRLYNKALTDAQILAIYNSPN